MRLTAVLFFWCSILSFISCSLKQPVPGNVYRGVLADRIKGFDPSQCSDLYSHICQKQVYEPLYEYKYLARPYDIQPCLAESLPRISADGLEYTIHLRKGIFFSDDLCFPSGKGREVVARDFIYSIKRLADVRTRTTGWWLFEDKIAGLNEFRFSTRQLKTSDTADYLSDVAGLAATSDSTLVIILTKPCPYFKYILTMSYAAVIPHEAVEYYADEFLNHPVGTGPYILKEWRRGLRLVFEKNPKYVHGLYPVEGGADDSAAGLLNDAGKPLPFIDRLEYYTFTETQPMILNFLRGNLERSGIPKDNYNNLINPDKTLREEYTDQGIQFIRAEDLDLTYTTFNFKDTLLGSRRKLRQAISLAVDVDKIIDLFYNGRAIRAQGPIPPGLFGYDATFRNPYQGRDVERAKRSLAEAGFPGGRGLPEFEYLTQANTTSRQMAEKFTADMAEIGIRIKIIGVTWPEFLERLKTSKFQIAGLAWMADYPDPENFLQLLYGPNEAPGENAANYKNAEYDSLYRKITVLTDGADRLACIKRMQAIVAEDCPWIFDTHRVSESLCYSWLKNYKPHIVSPEQVKYFRIDTDQRKRMLGQ
ncbi:MAG: hypothetical protein A2350_14525 [Candidatus Raymondbacteria bacterium RifOxyB12_full_50_8]|nr:MAG: hypothetical protein A2248_03270 [Candidatus Raymondbacteria bacterium RIFOXYA2_FULL_49_16]OGJ93281.1 MAG: hypothetical protein A2350_14525 [Candidatus Raymondbacteria bacterium RifOxyB12_full_50_8]